MKKKKTVYSIYSNLICAFHFAYVEGTVLLDLTISSLVQPVTVIASSTRHHLWLSLPPMPDKARYPGDGGNRSPRCLRVYYATNKKKLFFLVCTIVKREEIRTRKTYYLLMKYANTLTKGKNSSNKSLQIENTFNIFLHKTFQIKEHLNICAQIYVR